MPARQMCMQTLQQWLCQCGGPREVYKRRARNQIQGERLTSGIRG